MNRPLLALVLAALLVAPVVAADGDDWGGGERELEILTEPDRFELRSDRVAGDAHDEIRLELDGSNVRFDF
ncbi:MAG: hypothetical protein AABY30_03570 [Candidatus Thermoplasmatota archaeon]